MWNLFLVRASSLWFVFGWLVEWLVGFPILDQKSYLFNTQVCLKDNRYTSPILHEGFCTS